MKHVTATVLALTMALAISLSLVDGQEASADKVSPRLMFVIDDEVFLLSVCDVGNFMTEFGSQFGQGSGDRLGQGSGDRLGQGSGDRLGQGSGDRLGQGSGDRLDKDHPSYWYPEPARWVPSPRPPSNLEEDWLSDPGNWMPISDDWIPQPERAIPEPDQWIPQPERAIPEPDHWIPEPERPMFDLGHFKSSGDLELGDALAAVDSDSDVSFVYTDGAGSQATIYFSGFEAQSYTKDTGASSGCSTDDGDVSPYPGDGLESLDFAVDGYVVTFE